MADIRVTCPTCKTQLEIDAAYEGQEVECGSCLQVFVASTKKPKSDDEPGGRSGGKVRGSTSSSGRGSSRSKASRDRDDDDDDDDRGRRRRDDDDDDYDHDYAPRRRRSGGGNGVAVWSLVLGIIGALSLFGSCIPVLPVGCCCGLSSLGCSIAAIITGIIGMKNPEGKGMATTGMVLGILTLLAIVVLFVIGFAIGFGGAMNGNNPNPNPNNRFR